MAKMALVIQGFTECSRRLRAAIAEAAAEADPDQLTRLVEWLQQIQTILRQAESPPAQPASAADAARTGTSIRGAAKSAAASPKKNRASSYPRFFRDGENLVKVGWSKKERDEYQHKAPKAAISALAIALTKAGQRKRRFTMEQLLPVKDPQSAEDVPNYQIYLALAWLRDGIKLVDQHGRQGYTLGADNLADQIESHWGKLESH